MTALADDLGSALVRRAEEDEHFWSFGQVRARRSNGHGIFQYPAMMVPEMVEALIATLQPYLPTDRPSVVLDPFAGSGTVLAESMPFGFEIHGADINPLAILLCRAKTGPFRLGATRDAIARVIGHARRSRKRKLDVSDRIGSWYSPDAAVVLMRLRDGIRLENRPEVRRILWCVLAETARRSSNSRTSTFKLHVRSAADLASRTVDVQDIFRDLAQRAVDDLESHQRRLVKSGVLKDSRRSYRYDVHLHHIDTRKLSIAGPKADLVLTSPPYGDNRSTVPYGQHSWLPLSWVDLADAGPKITQPGNPYATDSASLGGRMPRSSKIDSDLLERSRSFGRIVSALDRRPPDRLRRVAAFVSDLDAALSPVVASADSNAPMIWVMGDRLVGGQRVPTTAILRELLESRGATHHVTLSRTIAVNRKRMPLRNSIASTMQHESILVMRAPAIDPGLAGAS